MRISLEIGIAESHSFASATLLGVFAPGGLDRNE